MAETKTWEPSEETAEVVKEFGHLLNNTGGNDPTELLRRYYTDDRLASTNVVVFTLASSVDSQVGLLRRLRKEGLI